MFKEMEKIIDGVEKTLLKQNVDKSKTHTILGRLREEIAKVPPPKIALIGLTGVGKSSTINALFNAGQPVSHIRACTKADVKIVADASVYTGSKGDIIVYDMPGIGEDVDADKNHYETYRNVLPEVDVIVWIFEAADRVMSPVQQTLLYLKDTIGTDFAKKLVIAVNKADLIYPGESSWNHEFNVPSDEQRSQYEDLDHYIKEKIYAVLPNWSGNIEIYSATKRYRLEQLMTAIVNSMDQKKKWTLGEKADVASPMELLPQEYRDYIELLLKNEKDKDKNKKDK